MSTERETDVRATADGWAGAPGQTDGVRVTIRAFGRFAVFIDDRPVAAAAWQSRKARELLRILVARRGRPVPRLELCEWLWPDDDTGRTPHRLSVLLSIIRVVCGPGALAADATSAALDLTRLRIDVEDFLGDVAQGIRLRERGAAAQARSILVAAERSCVGDVFEDEPYADWAVALREEARGAYLRAVRMLADLGRADGDADQAAAYLRLLLAKDPFDEAAHRELVEVLVGECRHGEARRAFARYRKAMAAIGVRVPDATLLSA